MSYNKTGTRIMSSHYVDERKIYENETVFRIVDKQYRVLIGIVKFQNDNFVIFEDGFKYDKSKLAYSRGKKIRIKRFIEVNFESTLNLGSKNEAYYTNEMEQIRGYIEPTYKELSLEEKIIYNSII